MRCRIEVFVTVAANEQAPSCCRPRLEGPSAACRPAPANVATPRTTRARACQAATAAPPAATAALPIWPARRKKREHNRSHQLQARTPSSATKACQGAACVSMLAYVDCAATAAGQHALTRVAKVRSCPTLPAVNLNVQRVCANSLGDSCCVLRSKYLQHVPAVPALRPKEAARRTWCRVSCS